MEELKRCTGRGNYGFATRDMSERHWTHLKSCTCDDDPYEDACQFCLCERGNSGFYTDEEIIKLLRPNATDQLPEEMEQLRVQLAGCGVAALSNTHESREQQKVNQGDYGYSASYQDVFDAVGREIKYREMLEDMAMALKEIVNDAKSYEVRSGRRVTWLERGAVVLQKYLGRGE
jgi:hypothetical protein